MKSLFNTILTVTLFTATVSAQNNKTPYFTKDFSGSSASNLRVETSGGSITVEGDNSDIKVEMYVQSNNWNGRDLSKDEIEERLKDYEVKVRLEGNTVVASARRKKSDWNWKNGLSISFKVFTPRDMKTDLSTSGGSIRLSKLSGNQKFATSGGSMNVSEIRGNVRGATSGGSIEASRMEGDIDLQTSGGSIRLSSMKGKVVAGTSGGSIRGEGLSGTIDVSTSGGSIRLADIAGSIKGSTSGGSVEAEIVRLGEYVELSTSAGSLRVKMPMDKGMDLDIEGSRVSVPLTNFSGKSERDYVKGKMNGGGIPVTLSASSGSVYVND